MSDSDRKAYEDLFAEGGGALLAQNDGLGPKPEDSDTETFTRAQHRGLNLTFGQVCQF